ncbi:hypothetical protein IMZ08_07710 [Bacillus luteolus]|uniref:Uncharacterized protein n=1 Tax=Litchfieldia luteola TaxID=682179 RepID=A0ABR9QHM5_9BACI|nr:hypothetical protein [Cytobacillus luteolus]MBE4907936.1 hypothetical protein [Cytobacillus luteolus]MBP1942715.1 hypothetical protein [Cytobacillus luteolus]
MIGPSFGSYSWFFDSEGILGHIRNSTLSISSNKNIFMFSEEKLSPGITVSDDFIVMNTGEEPVVLDAYIKFLLENNNTSNDDLLENYLVTVKIQDKLILSEVSASSISTINLFNDNDIRYLGTNQSTHLTITLSLKNDSKPNLNNVVIKPFLEIYAVQDCCNSY